MGLLDGKVAIVTGAGFGIGRAHAIELAAHGASVLVNDLGTSPSGEGVGRAPAEHVVEVIRSRGGRAAANFDDVADWSGAGRLIEHAVSEFGHLDALVNNAAIFRDQPLDQVSEVDWDSVIRVHLKGAAAPMHHAIRYWKDESAAGRPRLASIVNTTSQAGLVPTPTQVVRPAYVAAKAAVAALTQVMSYDLYDHGIRVNALSPTAYTRNAAIAYGGRPATEADEYLAGAPFDPLDPSGNSPLVVYLVSDRSLHVTGHVIRIHYGSQLQLMVPWQHGKTVMTDGKWSPEDIGTTLDTQIFGNRAPWPLDTAEQQRLMPKGS